MGGRFTGGRTWLAWPLDWIGSHATSAQADRLILDTDLLLAHACRNGTHRSAHALVIAAHAVQTGRTVASKDTKARFADLAGVCAFDL
ncbi:hypothetical protein GCM10022402_24380 [Salinactinospora qingdaonensis]|uniref:PIN domain-containing protein n=1 Tax=Salinactinospora qingdaonensis TaxID=702744 RepID=A0ABP7FPJ1_9ACTN